MRFYNKGDESLPTVLFVFDRKATFVKNPLEVILCLNCAVAKSSPLEWSISRAILQLLLFELWSNGMRSSGLEEEDRLQSVNG